MNKFRPGDRVADLETGEQGVVLVLYTDPENGDDYIVVRLDSDGISATGLFGR
jgi:hypothetical protein